METVSRKQMDGFAQMELDNSKKTLLYAAAALAFGVGILWFSGAFAADLGGNCCADLEERIAELEATAARKGNKKVSVVVTGSMNKALAFCRSLPVHAVILWPTPESRTLYERRGFAEPDDLMELIVVHPQP